MQLNTNSPHIIQILEFVRMCNAAQEYMQREDALRALAMNPHEAASWGLTCQTAHDKANIMRRKWKDCLNWIKQNAGAVHV
jgi:hypothetical protein